MTKEVIYLKDGYFLSSCIGRGARYPPGWSGVRAWKAQDSSKPREQPKRTFVFCCLLLYRVTETVILKVEMGEVSLVSSRKECV